MDQPRHKTIKVWYETYRTLKRLAAEKPEALAALVDRLVQDEVERRSVDRSVESQNESRRECS